MSATCRPTSARTRRAGELAPLVVARAAELGDGLERKFRVDDQRARRRPADGSRNRAATCWRACTGTRRRPAAGRRARSSPSDPGRRRRASVCWRGFPSATPSPRPCRKAGVCAASMTASRSLSRPRVSPVVRVCASSRSAIRPREIGLARAEPFAERSRPRRRVRRCRATSPAASEREDQRQRQRDAGGERRRQRLADGDGKPSSTNRAAFNFGLWAKSRETLIS